MQQEQCPEIGPEVSFPSLEEWIIVQNDRQDTVGMISRLWLTEMVRTPKPIFSEWITTQEMSVILGPDISLAKTEYATAVRELSERGSTATFPKILLRMRAEKSKHDEIFEFHKSQPSVSPARYLHWLHIGLKRYLSNRLVVYIDTCHWIKFRHCVLNSPSKDPIYEQLLSLLRALRLNERIVCPISNPTFRELLLQKDHATRAATARLMDELSGGICLQRNCDIFRCEIREFITKKLLGDQCPDYLSGVWSKVGYIMGERLPLNEAFDSVTMECIQKAYLDMVWSSSLEENIEGIDVEAFPHFDDESMAKAGNIDSRFYTQNSIPFEKVLEREKALAFHMNLKEDFLRIAQELYEKYPEEWAKASQAKPEALQADPFLFPSAQILAVLNTIFITSKERFAKNDIVDAEHASLALPYCDVFFCDGPLAHKLQVGPITLADIYKTKVASKPRDLTIFLQQYFKNED